MVDVTVLVAVYNTAEYLPKCMESLLGQTLGNIQIVCIDDCSTDTSPDVLRHYAAIDSRIVAIRLDENHGQAYARNEGLKVATGRYITFLDSDDWLAPDALQSAVSAFAGNPQADCVLFNVVLASGADADGGKAELAPYPMQHFVAMTGREAFNASLDWSIHGVYMARRELYARFPYDDTCRAYSDDNTTRLHYIASREVGCCQGTYFYRQHAGSVSHKATVRRFDHLKANESMKAQLVQLGVGDDVTRRYETIRWLVLIDTYMFYHCHGGELTKSQRRYGLDELRRVWKSMDKQLIDASIKHKFGYRTMPCWPLFRAQEWLYFTLKGILGRNK